MQETIFTSIILISLFFFILLIGLILIVKKYYESKEKHDREIYDAVILTQENERERISQDIHDELGGLIVASRLSLESIDIDNVSIDNIDKINQIKQILERASLSARNVALELSPAALNRFGLSAALRDIQNIYKTYKGIFEINCIDIKLKPSLEIGIYRILGEMINNSIKYSKSDIISVNIYIDEFKVLHLLMDDNGVGFNIHQIRKGANGIENIKNRCKVLGGTFSLSTDLNKGCHYHLKFKNNYLYE